MLSQEVNEVSNLLLFRLRMPSEYGERRVVRDYLLSDGDIGQKHKLLDHKMSAHMLILTSVSRVLPVNIQLELDLR